MDYDTFLAAKAAIAPTVGRRVEVADLHPILKPHQRLIVQWALPVEDRSRLFTAQTLREVYDYESHIRIGEDLDGRGALPATFMSLAPGSWHPEVWHDINRMLTLNTEQSARRQALHVCPLQTDIVDRLIRRYSNPGELVYDPFGGLGTVPVRALKLGRKGRGVELNPGYFLDAVKYLEAQERERDMPSLFDLDEDAAA